MHLSATIATARFEKIFLSQQITRIVLKHDATFVWNYPYMGRNGLPLMPHELLSQSSKIIFTKIRFVKFLRFIMSALIQEDSYDVSLSEISFDYRTFKIRGASVSEQTLKCHLNLCIDDCKQPSSDEQCDQDSPFRYTTRPLNNWKTFLFEFLLW